MDELLNTLKNPNGKYRAVPFWSWNEKLKHEMLIWQIHEMHKAGLGGYIMHARGGLQTSYLSDEWMDCIDKCIKESKKLGMDSWVYDEEGWPSGFAGGIVTSLGDEYHLRWIEIYEIKIDDIYCYDNVLGIYRTDKNFNRIENITIGCEKVENYKEKVLIAIHKSNPYYIDTLNENTVRAFIECTYEKYYKRFESEFVSKGKIPWSYIIVDKFKNRYDYDILDNIPALFYEYEGYEKIRYDYWALVNELFIISYAKQIYEWCERHKCQITGHVMNEDSLESIMEATAGCMAFYEYMHIPGIDWLGRNISTPVIPKQVSSVAIQLGKKFVISETFAMCGWNVSFEELKWIAEWQYINGINFMCQHLEGYSLRGARKRDYPPSLFYQQPWWSEYGLFNNYFARLGALLTSGKNVAKVLLLHPMRSAWLAYNSNSNDELKKLDDDFIKVSELLAGLHIDHHYGDETILSKYARVEKGKFFVGEGEYDLVILPSLLVIDESTLNLLESFVENNGIIISVGDFPKLMNGIKYSELDFLKQKVVHLELNCSALYSYLKDHDLINISISDREGEVSSIHYQQRDLGDQQVFFMVNLDPNIAYSTFISIKGMGCVKKLNMEFITVEDVNYENEVNNTTFKLDFLPMQSHVIIFSSKIEENVLNKENIKDELLKLENEWIIEAADNNSLTLDSCSYSIDEGEWQAPIPVIKLFDILLNLRRSSNIAQRYCFDVRMNLNNNKEFFLVVEKADEFEIYINGEKLAYKNIGYWKDIGFDKIDIKSMVRNGINEVILKRKFFQRQQVYDVLYGENVHESEKNRLTYDVELESIYVVGDFGVISKSKYIPGEKDTLITNGPFIIVDSPAKVKCGDIARNGFCFFAGRIKLCQNIKVFRKENKKLIIDLKKPYAVLSKVYVNDIYVRSLAWFPYYVDITDYIYNGINKITIELFGSNRNLLGPHHHTDCELYNVSPLSFKWTESRNGTWRNSYCFVKFGLQDK